MTFDTPTLIRGGGLTIGAGEYVRFLNGIAKWLIVLNLLDGIFTLIWVEHFGAGEWNVVMRNLVYESPLLFMLVKLTVVSLGTIFLWRHRSRALAVISLFVAFFSYFLVVLYHLQYSSQVFL